MPARVLAPRWSMSAVFVAMLLSALALPAKGPCWVLPPRVPHLNDDSTHGYVPTRWRIWTPPICIDEEAPMTKVPEMSRAETGPIPDGRRTSIPQETRPQVKQPVGRPTTLIGESRPGQ